jgi:uncharacterized damage-inducible protein DinB
MTTNPTAEVLIHSFRLNTRLFTNCLTDVDEEVARKRLTPNTNNLLFLAVHLVDERFFMDVLFGGTYDAPFPELSEVESVDQMPIPGPSIDRALHLWTEISDRLEPRLFEASDEIFKTASPFKFPPSGAPQEGRMALSFLLHHESYHIGQMALLRKGLNLPPMRYD